MRSRRHCPVAVLVLLAAVLLSAAFAANALALPNFTDAVNGVGPCATCHGGAYPTGVHAVSSHAAFITTCTKCHLSGTGTPPLPTACAASNCHGGTPNILSAHQGMAAPAAGCATTVGCHGVAAAATVASIAPVQGPVGTKVAITGTGFGALQLTGTVMFGTTAATIVSWSPTSIVATVPASLVPGPVDVVVTPATGTASAAVTFTVTTVVTKPAIGSLSPTAGKRGAAVVIVGKRFGAHRGTSFVKFGKVKVGKYLLWSKTKIKVRVPLKAAFGLVKVTVTTTAGTSNAKSFRVRR